MASPSTYTVACKLPNGLLAEVADIKFERIGSDNIATKENVRSFRFNGSAPQRLMESDGQTIGETDAVRGGFGLTHNVPADFWERWIEENKNYAPVRAGLIFASPNPAKAAAEATEKRALRSGLEPIKPTQHDEQGRPVGEIDPRMGRQLTTADKPS